LITVEADSKDLPKIIKELSQLENTWTEDRKWKLTLEELEAKNG